MIAYRKTLGLLNLTLLFARWNLWRVDPRRFWINASTIPIDRPIFLLGVQGGGLTLTARMLRRCPGVVSVTGDHTYWAGPDEMQNVMGAYLPAELTGLHHKKPLHPAYPERDWLYATDDLLPLYRRTAADASEELARQFKRAIRLPLAIFANNQAGARFVDKSQTFTVRLSLIQKLLKGCGPRFILITRNPYAMCYRAALETTPVSQLPLPLEKRLELAAQHWANSFRCALEDAPETTHLMVIRFEDLLQEPEHWLREICAFAGLDFRPSMLPAPGQSIPLGSTGSVSGDGKWYPLQPQVNRRYLKRLKPWMAEVIDRYVCNLAGQWDYSPKGP